MYEEIYVSDLINILKTKQLNLIDIRDNYKYAEGTILNSKNIPYRFLITNPNNYLNMNEKYYIFCNQGITSEKVCSYLSKLGYSVVNIIGGYNEYLEEDSK